MGFATRLIAGTAATLTAGTVVAAAGVWLTVRDQVATITVPAAVAPETGTAAGDAALAVSGGAGAPALAAHSGGTNIVVLGSDSRTSAGNAAAHTGARADTTMLIHLAADNSWAYTLSLPRDLVVNLPTSSPACAANMPARDRLNEAYTFGGPECTAAAVSKVTGLHIDHIAAVDFTGFARVVDAAGGYTVCLTEPVDDVDAGITLPAGTSHIDGADTLGLVRMRKTVSDGSDISRTARQRWIMADFARQLSEQGALTNPVTAWRISQAVADNVDVDSGLTNPGTIASMLSTASGLASGNQPGSTFPWLPNPDDPDNTVVENRREAAPLLADLAADRLPGTGGGETASPAPSTAPPTAMPMVGATPTPSETPTPDNVTANNSAPAPFCVAN